MNEQSKSKIPPSLDRRLACLQTLLVGLGADTAVEAISEARDKLKGGTVQASYDHAWVQVLNAVMAEHPALFHEAEGGNLDRVLRVIKFLAVQVQQPARTAPVDLDAAVSRFLAWRLPDSFNPDGGISFNKEPDARGYVRTWPTGTNLLDADQARAMLEHVLGLDNGGTRA